MNGRSSRGQPKANIRFSAARLRACARSGIERSPDRQNGGLLPGAKGEAALTTAHDVSAHEVIMRFNTNAATSTFAALLGLGACGTNAYPAFAGIFGDGEGGAASGGEDGGDGSASTGYGSSSGSNPSGGDDAAGNSPTPTGSCATGTCNGCCDSSGNCDTSGLDDSCGLGGTACVDCTQTGQTCQNGTCAGSSSGGPSGSSSGSSGGRSGSSSGGCLFGILCSGSSGSGSSSGGRASDGGVGGYDGGRRHYDGG